MVRFGAVAALLAGMTVAGDIAIGTARAGTINAAITTEDGAPVGDAVVFAIPATPAAAATSAKAVMLQENQAFSPFVLPVQTGTTVEFPNRDSFRHHVYSFSPAKPFELKLFGGTEMQRVTFDKEGVIALGCNIHDNMLAYIFVAPTPHLTKTGEDGKATLTNLPAGEYTVKVWHPSQKTGSDKAATMTIAATGAQTFTAALAMKRERKSRKPAAKDETEY